MVAKFATKDAWVGAVVKNAQGYYVVETCYKEPAVSKEKYPTMEEAKEAANKCAFNFTHRKSFFNQWSRWNWWYVRW